MENANSNNNTDWAAATALTTDWVALWNGDGGGVPGAGAPVGTAVTFHGTDILRVAINQVVEYWLNADTLDLMTQLQVAPPAPA